MKEYELGLIVGKFYPFHNGHEYLIRTGLSRSKHLVVAVVANRKKELISAETRSEWIKETFQDLDVRIIEDIEDDDNSKAWADYTRQFLGCVPDAVFTSEDYGVTWAAELGCAHVCVDKARRTIPISGTLVRSNPFKYWDYLPYPTRRYFTPRIVLIGAESTGKSTLAEQLAAHYQTNLVHEYGRYYVELQRHNKDTKLVNGGLSVAWHEQDFVNIATTQNLICEQLSANANKLLICDTDAFATSVWHYRYTKKWSKKVARLIKKVPLLYLVTPPDIPFTQDGTRDGQKIRRNMHQWVLSALKRDNRPYHIVEGGLDQQVRLDDAIKAVDSACQAWVESIGWRE